MIKPKRALIGRLAPLYLSECLKHLKLDLYKMPENQWSYAPVNDHPDLYITRVDEEDVWVIDNRLLNYFESNGHMDPTNQTAPFLMEDMSRFYRADYEIGPKYPQTISLSVIFYKKYYLGKLNQVDPVLKHRLSELGYIGLNVNQGYVKCATLKVSDDVFLTSDSQISTILQRLGATVITINPSSIKLNGFKHGFIGGAAFRYNEVVYFIGNIETLYGGDELKRQLCQHHVKWTCLSQGHLEDVGSVEFF